MDNRRYLTIPCLVLALGASTPLAFAEIGAGAGDLGAGIGIGDLRSCDGDWGFFNGNSNFGSNWGADWNGDYRDNFVRPPPQDYASQTGAAANCQDL